MLSVANIDLKAQQTKKQCTATTTKGIQCKKTATDGQTTCSIHSESRIRCGATTSTGKACKLAVKISGDKCRFHSIPPTQ